MNFSKLKLNKLTESTAQAYFGTEDGSATNASDKQKSRPDRTGNIRALQSQGNSQRTGQVTKGTPIAGTPTPRSGGYDRKIAEEHFRELRQEQELLKRLREHKSDWRSELYESAAPEPMDKEMHPYVDVMPHADHNLRTLKKQMADGALEKVGKDIKQESVEVSEAAPLAALAAPLAGKLAGGLAAKGATAGAAKVGGGIAKAASSKLGKTAIQMGANKVGDSVENSMSEEVEELDEAKKKCKSGYTYDKKKKKCVKKKKKSSSSKKSSPTYVYIGRPGYGGGHHHHGGHGGGHDGGDSGESNGNGGGGDAGGGDGGGGGE